ncbi:hypothetical protein M407DRAFT_120293 [Tulasnella calospora MUT 4182]|uniref:CFEM domain-containing protein n=1 Tax=Tulasnella calospora MUT 4182 TaxID=1051891 RepID=A0A0C3KL54_9AGAM|nr:hypothetical protein M407DRAFT_120293 [Tulasnella calospora MUT 4182]
MRFSIAVFWAASLASAYTILKRQTDVPQCAQTCYTQSNPSPCNTTDIPCLCVNPTFLNELTTCTQNTCSQQDLGAAQAWGLDTCKQAGVDLQNPVPACAKTCVENAPLGNCQDKTDVACLCKDPTYTQSVVSCAQSSCTDQDLKTATIVGEASCRAAGVDVSSTASA